MERAVLKKICVDFFRYWWNHPGQNTEQGFDEWIETDAGKQLTASVVQLALLGDAATTELREAIRLFCTDDGFYDAMKILCKLLGVEITEPQTKEMLYDDFVKMCFEGVAKK